MPRECTFSFGPRRSLLLDVTVRIDLSGPSTLPLQRAIEARLEGLVLKDRTGERDRTVERVVTHRPEQSGAPGAAASRGHFATPEPVSWLLNPQPCWRAWYECA